MKASRIVLVTFLLIINFLPIAVAKSVLAEKSENFNIGWRLVHDGIIHKVWEIEVQNLKDATKDVNLGSLFENTNFDISELRNVKFYEWKALIGERIFWFDNENAPIYSTYVVDNIVHENENNLLGYQQYSKVENIPINQWKPCKMQMSKLATKSYSENYGFINIPKFESKPKYDNFGSIETENGIKRFRLEFDIPIIQGERGWGSSGKIALLIDDVEYHPWWDSNWQYRVPITLNTHENIPENYQYRIVLDKVDNLNSHCLDNFQDVRFLEEEDSSEFSFWIENYISGDNAIFWVKRIDNSLTDNTIYCYYGNASAGSAENGDETFLFFDHFPSTSLDTSKWTGDTEFATVSNSILTYIANAEIIYTQSVFSGDVAVKFYDYSYSGGQSGRTTRIGFGGSDSWANGADIAYKNFIEGAGSMRISKSGTGTSVSTNWTFNTWKVSEIILEKGSRVRWFENENELTGSPYTDTTYIPTSDNNVIICSINAERIKVDWILVRKYVSPEPTASVGAEESNVVPNPPTSLLCENQTSPQRLTTFTPDFSFLYVDNDGDNMKAFQIQVGTSAGDNSMWDNTTTENAENNTTVTITYAGSTLTRGTQYWWRVKVQDNNDVWSAWSDNENFKINQLPTCSITAPPDGHDAGVNEGISFESSASDADGDSLTYLWDFGEGTTSTSENQSHQYSSGGDYTVNLTVNDGYEDSVADSITVNVTGEAAPPSPPSGVGGPSVVEKVAEEIEAVVQPAKNVLFTWRPFGIPIFFPALALAALTYVHEDRRGIKTTRGISYALWMLIGFLLVMGAHIA